MAWEVAAAISGVRHHERVAVAPRFEKRPGVANPAPAPDSRSYLKRRPPDEVAVFVASARFATQPVRTFPARNRPLPSSLGNRPHCRQTPRPSGRHLPAIHPASWPHPHLPEQQRRGHSGLARSHWSPSGQFAAQRFQPGPKAPKYPCYARDYDCAKQSSRTANCALAERRVTLGSCSLDDQRWDVLSNPQPWMDRFDARRHPVEHEEVTRSQTAPGQAVIILGDIFSASSDFKSPILRRRGVAWGPAAPGGSSPVHRRRRT